MSRPDDDASFEAFAVMAREKCLRLAVVGLGYVGLPVAASYAAAGFHVTGIERDAARAARIRRGECPIEGEEPGLAALIEETVSAGRLTATDDPSALGGVDAILVCVETPIEADRLPRYAALEAAITAIAAHARDGALLVVESTLAPGTMDRKVRAWLERAGRAGDLFVGHCPERVMPGRLLQNLRAMSRVLGGDSSATSRRMRALYSNIVEADLDEASCVAAELTKTAENTYRDVNIAFANELALACEASGADFLEVRALVNKSPGRNVLLAGLGVGGHCIPKDPWLFAASREGTSPLRLVPTARLVNDEMPLHVAELAEGALREAGRAIDGAVVTVLGYAYLEESDDERNSPSETLVHALRARGAEVRVHDPFVARFSGSLDDALRGADVVVIAVAHRAYREIDWAKVGGILRTRALVDARLSVTPDRARELGFVVRGVGRG